MAFIIKRQFRYICTALFVVTWFTSIAIAQINRIKFDHISFEDGLSQSSVHCILQDSKGFMWFGTLDGLNKYDGYTIKEYRHKPEDPYSIADNSITAIFEDSKDVLWIGTRGMGISLYDRIKDRFTHLRHEPKDINSLSSNTVYVIFEDNKGNIWIGTEEGLDKYDRATKTFKHYQNDPKNKNSISNNIINDIISGKNNELWIATDRGLNRLDIEKDRFIRYQHIADTASLVDKKDAKANRIRTLCMSKDGTLWIGTDKGLVKRERVKGVYSFSTYIHNPADNLSISDNTVTSIVADVTGYLWIGTENGGLNRYDPEKEEFRSYVNDPSDNNSLSINNILTIYQDKTHILWIGTSLGGINKWNRAAEEMEVFRHDPYNIKSLSSNQVRTIYQDRIGQIWVGTVDGGLNKWVVEEDSFIHFKNNPNDNKSISNNHVRTIFEDSKGNFWIGTDGGGLDRFDTKKLIFQHFVYDEDNPASISSNHIWKIYEDSKNNLWIGTNGGGLCLMDVEKGTFTTLKNDPKNPKSISNDRVTSILEDQRGYLWVGTYGGGLSRWDYNTRSFTHYKYNENDSTSLGNDRVYTIFEDKEGTLWIGTKGNLNRFEPKTNSFVRFDETNGLPNDVVMGILEDNAGLLWITTNKGLSKFDKKSKFRNYDVRDGLQSNEFLVGSFCKAKDGQMFFGGIHGFNAFNPDKIIDNQHIPEIVITGFQIFNIAPTLDSIISEKKILHLSYRDYSFSFDFVALDYIFPEKNQYAYIMEGFDKEWNMVNGRRFANYTNLKPGKYVFKVKGSNNDGIWNEQGISLVVDIEPAFWQTLWFKILLIILAIVGIFVFYKWRIRAVEARNRKLEEMVVLRTAEIQRQKDEIGLQRDQIEAQKYEIEAQRDAVSEQRDQIAQAKKEITDSIIYAKRIQNATLPTEVLVDGLWRPDYFILFRPKDIVSGDFYWTSFKDNKLIIIAADCTGHGVPGAFMSMLGISFLNKIVNERGISKPHEILNRLRENVIRSLHQTGAEDEARDGMDISLCTVDFHNKRLEYAGANNPLYLIRKSGTVVIKPDKMPIAIYDMMDSFTTHEVDVNDGDVFYIFSDGYADQFGGPGGKKFKYQPFKELLESIWEKPMTEQRDILNKTIVDWMAHKDKEGIEYEQIDDIVVIGMRFTSAPPTIEKLKVKSDE